MKKVPDVSPSRRGRALKKHLVTPETSASSVAGASQMPNIGKKVSSVSQTSKEASITQQKKRHGSRSVESVTVKRRRQGSSDTTESANSTRSISSSGMSSKPPRSRTSSKEKVETPLLSRTMKQRMLQGLDLESPSLSISGKMKSQGDVGISQKNKPERNKTGKYPKDQVSEVKDAQLLEIKRLSTTDGFWSSKTSSRSNSPLGQPFETLVQKQVAAAVKKGSRTSTPDSTPSGSRKKSNKLLAEKDDTATLKPNIPVKDQRRLKTKDGLSSQDLISTASRTGSQNVSPSSTSSLDRGTRQAAKTLTSGIVNNIKSDNGGVTRGRSRIKSQLKLVESSHNLLESQMESSEAISLDVSATDQIAIDSPVSRFTKKVNKFSGLRKKTKQEQLPENIGHKKSSLHRRSNKNKHFNNAPVVPHLAGDNAHIDPISCTSTNTDPSLSLQINTLHEKRKSRPVKHRMLERVIRRSPLKMRKTGAKKTQNNLSNTDFYSLENPPADLSSDVLSVNETILQTSNVSPVKPLSPEFAISDLLGSTELKRLNTTAGFWASMPDMGSVLSITPHRRLRDVDSGSTKAASDHEGRKQIRQAKMKLSNHQKTSMKPQSTLLQHRKKRLHALQNSHRKVKQSVSNDDLQAQDRPLYNTMPMSFSEATTLPKPKSRKLYFGGRKRRYKRKLKLSAQLCAKTSQESRLNEPSERGGVEMDAGAPIDSVISRTDTNEQTDSSAQEIINNKQVRVTSTVTDASVAGTLPSKKVMRKWKQRCRKVTPGNVATKSSDHSNIRTRGKKKVESGLMKSLEILEKLDPGNNNEIISVILVTSKVRSERRKLKNAKRHLQAGSSLAMDVSVDIKDTTPYDGTGVNRIENPLGEDSKQYDESRSKITNIDNGGNAKHDKFQKRSPRQKKDNLFESFGYSPLMPSAVVTEEPRVKSLTDEVTDASSLPENVKFGMVPSSCLSSNNLYDHERHDENKALVKPIIELQRSGTSSDELPSVKINETYNSGINYEKSNTGKLVETHKNELPSEEIHKVDKSRISEINLEDIHRVMVDKTEIKIDDVSLGFTKDIPKLYSSTFISETCTRLPLGMEEVETRSFDKSGKSENGEPSLEVGEESKSPNDIHTSGEFPLQVEGDVLDEKSKNQNILSEGLSVPNSLPAIEDKKTNVKIDFTNVDKVATTDSDREEEKETKDEIFPSNVDNGNMKANKEMFLTNGDKLETTIVNEEMAKLPTIVKEMENTTVPANNNLCQQLYAESEKTKTEDNLLHDPENVNNTIHVEILAESALSSSEGEVGEISARESIVSTTKGDQINISTMEAMSEGNEQYRVLTMNSKDSIESKVSLHNESDSIFNKDIEAIVADVLAATFTGSHDTSVNTASSLPVENTKLKRRRKRKRRSTQFIRRKTHRQTTTIAVPSMSSEIHVGTGDVITDKETLVNENHKELPGSISKRMLKKSRKRRRNAWQRGVLKKAANISRKAPKQEWHINSLDVQQETLTPSVLSNVDSLCAIPDNLPGETNERHVVETSSAVKKSLKNMLKKLETNANLAHAVLDEKAFRGRFLRNVQRKVLNERRLYIKRKKINPDASTEEKIKTSSSDMGIVVHADIPEDTLPAKRKRGRPKKQSSESLPKLTPLHMLPMLRNATPWNKTPPNLSPQALSMPKPSIFLNVDEAKNAQDPDVVGENVDDTDLHLYLSGVSDEEQSPKKDLSQVVDINVFAQIPIYQQDKNEDSVRTQDGNKDKLLDMMETSKPMQPGAVSGERPRKVRPKMKGRKGCPPGMPMTDEERRKKAQMSVPSKMLLYGGLNLHRGQKISKKTTHIPIVCTPPAGATAAKFSLRQKFTRSPLEMLAMKRKQEEERYDLEQEKRQARLIHLREKRSARESGDGFSDDGESVPSPGNLMGCSVVLSDFVKKLQLDDIEPSSGEEVNNQTVQTESPEFNSYNDQDSEDWCADFQDNEDEEWNNNRPYIPRLKLKRVIKKGTPSQSKIKKTQPPKEKQHEPIKLVIKTEPLSEPHEQAGAKSNLFIDSSKERSGFENCYMDFLKEKNLPNSRTVSTIKRSYNKSKPVQSKGGTQNSAPDLSSLEIISLPAAGSRASSITVHNNSTTFVEPALAKSSTSPFSAVNTILSSADKLTNLEFANSAKVLSSVDDEEDDILILDLEDGAVDRNSEEMLKDLCSFEQEQTSDVPVISSETNSQNNKVPYPDQPAIEVSSCDNGTLTRTQRTLSNDEMGLMLESYKSHKDVDTVGQTNGEPNANFVSAEKFSENKETTEAGDVPEVTNCIVMESESTKASGPVNSIHEPFESDPVIVSRDEPLLHSEKKDGPGNTDSCAIAMYVNLTQNETDDLGESVKEKTSVPCAEEDEGETILRSNQMVEQLNVDRSSLTGEDINLKEAGSILDSELQTAASDKVVESVLDTAILDNNNLPLSLKAPKVSASVKKQSDSSKSPKHSTYHGSEPEDWKIKVILNSDKIPSGKYSCKRCDFTSPAKLTIESHIYSHIPGVQFRCAYCGSEFSSMASTSSHLKNTHTLSEAKFHISRHIDEKNFYDKEAVVFPEETGQQSPVQATCASTNAGGQSPPVIISVVVSGGVGSSRGGRSSAPARRFVCTHCGFSTNVKEDAEHHVLDLHSSQALFACLLCSENVCYTESEIKDHCAIVHPARNHPYKKLPDFYDAEQLSLKEREVAEDDNIFERMTSMFQDDTPAGSSTIDHRQKAKEYLDIQERLRAKTRVEADSTTAVDYMEEHDNTEEQSAPQTPSQEESTDETGLQIDETENEVSNDPVPSSETHDVDTVLTETAALTCDDAAITSSAGSGASVVSSVDSQVAGNFDVTPSELSSHLTAQNKDATICSRTEGSEVQSAVQVTTENHSQENCPPLPSHDNMETEDDDGEGIGLKIVQVVSLSGQSDEDIIDDRIPAELGAQGDLTDTDIPAEDSTSCQTVPGSSENTTTCLDNALELSAKPRQLPTEESSKQTESQSQSTVEQQKTTSENEVAHRKLTPSSSAETTASPSVTNPSFASGLPLSYKCNACKVHTPYLLMMVKHLKARHPNMHCFSCPYCKTTHSFVSQKQLRHHVKQSHRDKFGRNEIALSEDAKKFVEAMVLPMGPECIQVGNRIVLEKDIHTCTYCQVKMTSLANVYEHLNTNHSDLFEFVCPMCYSFKSKQLPEISDHCMKTHKSSLDTDKVHVSVPKNLFTALTCISKNGKYIEKAIVAGTASSTSASSEQQLEKATSSVLRKEQQVSGATKESHISVTEHFPLRLTPTSTSSFPTTVTQVTQPIFAIPFVSGSIGVIPAATSRPVLPIASALFDTSSLTASSQLTATPQPIPIIQNAAAASFLSPAQQTFSNSQHHQSSKQLHIKSTEKAQGAVKNLPVLNVPTIKPRGSSAPNKSLTGGRKPDDYTPADVVSQSIISTSSIASLLTTTSPSQRSIWGASSASSIDNLPDDEPNPDAFKIFNLRPTGPRISPSSISPNVSPSVPSVFPPVSSPLTSGYIQGPIAGFPPGMVISPNLHPLSFPYTHQPLVAGMLAQKQCSRGSPLLRHPRMSHQTSLASLSTRPVSTVRPTMASQEATTAFLQKKQQQQQELYLLKKQRQLEAHRDQLIRQNQQQALPRAHPAHQQPPSLSGQVYQPQPLPVSSLPFDHQLQGPSDLSQTSFPLSSTSSLSSTGPPSSAHQTPTLSSSPVRPIKGVHKRSYQCPYCPIMVRLEALDVASHIHEKHPGKQVTFRKIV